MKEFQKYELIQNRMKLVNMLPKLIHNTSMDDKSFNSELAGLFNIYSNVDCDTKPNKSDCGGCGTSCGSSDGCNLQIQFQRKIHHRW